jgi:drug/metabolite transporter (DMT)-like permease
MNRTYLPGAAFLICGTVWGTTFLAIRVGNESLPALWACSLRLILAAAILALLVVATRQAWPKGEALAAACWYGFFEFGVGLPLLYWGERVVPSGLAAVLYAICPISAMIGAKVLGMEHFNSRKVGAALFAFAGVVIIFWREALAGSSPAGIASILLAAFAAPMAALMLQRGPRQSAIASNAVGALVGIPTCIATSFALGEAHAVPTTIAQWGPIAYLAVMSSVIAFGVFAWLVNHWKATTVSFLGVIVPVIAVIAGAAFKGEHFAPGAPIGAAIVIAGVVAALRSDSLATATSEA